jgi:hypothetical protein
VRPFTSTSCRISASFGDAAPGSFTRARSSASVGDGGGGTTVGSTGTSSSMSNAARGSGSVASRRGRDHYPSNGRMSSHPAPTRRRAASSRCNTSSHCCERDGSVRTRLRGASLAAHLTLARPPNATTVSSWQWRTRRCRRWSSARTVRLTESCLPIRRSARTALGKSGWLASCAGARQGKAALAQKRSVGAVQQHRRRQRLSLGSRSCMETRTTVLPGRACALEDGGPVCQRPLTGLQVG